MIYFKRLNKRIKAIAWALALFGLMSSSYAMTINPNESLIVNFNIYAPQDGYSTTAGPIPAELLFFELNFLNEYTGTTNFSLIDNNNLLGYNEGVTTFEAMPSRLWATFVMPDVILNWSNVAYSDLTSILDGSLEVSVRIDFSGITTPFNIDESNMQSNQTFLRFGNASTNGDSVGVVSAAAGIESITTVSSVPLPPSAILFLSGIAVLIVKSRKKV